MYICSYVLDELLVAIYFVFIIQNSYETQNLGSSLVVWLHNFQISVVNLAVIKKYENKAIFFVLPYF